MEHSFIYQLAKITTIILLCFAGFTLSILIIKLVIQIVGNMIFGQKFDEWWDNKFWL